MLIARGETSARSKESDPVAPPQSGDKKIARGETSGTLKKTIPR
jgi:hypothetical protein